VTDVSATPMSSAAEPASPVPAVAVVLLTALAYAAVGLVALQLAIPPTYAAPLYPPAGIALAAALTFGRAAVPGVWLGSFTVNVYAASLRGALTPEALVLPALLGVGAALQAEVGRALVARWCGQPATLSEPREVAHFYILAVPLSCLTSTTVATASFVALGVVTAAAAPFLWWTWWAGDTLGVLIGAPIALTLVGRPRADWAGRRLTLGLPLLAITALLAAAILQVARWDEQRVAGRFDRDARAAAAALAERLQQPLYALEAMRSLYVGSERVDDAELRAAIGRWIALEPALRAAGHSEWVARDAVPALEARRRADGVADFRVFDRADGIATDGDGRLMVITQIEPADTNRAALGLNQMSIPAVRTAIEQARRNGAPVASAGFRLTQETGERTGVVIYQVLYDGEPATVDERLPRTRGLVFVTVEPDRLVATVRDAQPAYLRLCLVDSDPLTPRPLLGGPPECRQPPGDNARALVVPLAFAGRQWDIRVSAAAGAVPDEQRGSAFLFSLAALAAAALLGALLLSVTGRTRRIEVAVAQRTADLQREVTERQRAEAALRDREQRLQAIFDAAPAGIVYTELDGRILVPNPAFCAFVGRPAEALVGHTLAEITHPDEVAEARARLAALGRGEVERYRCARRYLRPDGSIVHAQVTVALLRDEAGRPHRTVGIIEDVGEQLKRAQAERERDAAAASSRAKSEFVSRMSHELRTPLNAMLGFAQLLDLDRQPPLAPHQAAWTAQIQRAGWHLLHMINDTLDLSRIESGTLRLQPETLDLRELLPACTALVEQAARERGVRVAADIDPAAASVRGDLTRVKQVLTNLLSNAVKYNVDGGTVHVRTRAADGGRVEIDVVDTGLGMTPEQLAHLFEPFNRLGRETSGAEGSGIGLVISLRLAELMGGSLRATSTPGAGSCFTLTLPRGEAAGAAVAAPEADEPAAVRYRRRHVLYVEDNAINAEVMRGVLAKRPQVRLDVSPCGLDALAAIRARRPDLVLLDMHLPDIDGLELLRRLKGDPDTEDIPVVAVSADATRERVAQALHEGAAQYLTKPLNVAELLAVVDDLLERQDTRFG
jgi:PAS domain S-box-containing protein